MKYVVLIILIFILLVYLFSKTKCNSSHPSYEPNKYDLTRRANLYGVVTRTIERKNFFGVVIETKCNAIYPFSYVIEKMPVGWKSRYPQDFIQMGDTLFKKPDNDSFYVIIKSVRWLFILPNKIDSARL